MKKALAIITIILSLCSICISLHTMDVWDLTKLFEKQEETSAVEAETVYCVQKSTGEYTLYKADGTVRTYYP